MFERNRFAKWFMWGMAAFWGVYLILIGLALPPMMRDIRPGMEPYHLFNGGMMFLLCLDFWLRFIIQQTPSQEVKPYALLPIKRRFLINTFLVRRIIDSYNLIWFFLLVPFACITLFTQFGVIGIVGFLMGWWLLIAMNSQFYLLCRTLINYRIWYLLLPFAFYGLLALFFFVTDKPDIYHICMNWGEGFIHFNPISILIVLIFISVLFTVNHKLSSVLVYSELSKIENVKLKHVSNFSFLERYGEIGEYLKLEVKCTIRCKTVKKAFVTGIALIVLFSVILSLSTVYDSYFMRNFICVYCFSVLGIMTLSQIMGFEGNYIDGLMSRKESILSLLRAKYYFHCIMTLLPLLLMLPTMIVGKISVLMVICYIFQTTGPIYFTFFQMAVYNKQTIPLNTKFIGRSNTNSFLQSLIVMAAFFIPISLNKVISLFAGDNTAMIVLLIIGLIFTLTNGIWLKNIYVRFMKRRYENMEGFRSH